MIVAEQRFWRGVCLKKATLTKKLLFKTSKISQGKKNWKNIQINNYEF